MRSTPGNRIDASIMEVFVLRIQSVFAARQAVREIQQLYEMKDEVLPEFQYILDQPIETVLQLKANLMRCWINTYQSILTKRSYNTALTAD